MSCFKKKLSSIPVASNGCQKLVFRIPRHSIDPALVLAQDFQFFVFLGIKNNGRVISGTRKKINRARRPAVIRVTYVFSKCAHSKWIYQRSTTSWRWPLRVLQTTQFSRRIGCFENQLSFSCTQKDEKEKRCKPSLPLHWDRLLLQKDQAQTLCRKISIRW